MSKLQCFKIEVGPRCLSVLTLGITVCLSGSLPAHAKTVTYPLKNFLEEVSSKHDGLRASRETVAGADLKQNEGDVLLVPNLFATGQGLYDKRETANVATAGDLTTQQSVSLGVGKLFESGTQVKLSYGVANTKISGVSPNFVPQDHFYTAGPTLEVSQPLWRNAGGSETALTRDLIRTQANLTKDQEAFKSKLTLAEAEMVYWRLVLARETVAALKENLERFQKLKSWNARRVSDALADKSDLLQAEAGVKARQLDLQGAIDEERAASRAFNLARGHGGENVSEGLEIINAETVNTLQPAPRKGPREDVKVAEQVVKIADLTVRSSEQKYTPTLEAFGSIGLNGRDKAFGDAAKESFQTTNPMGVIGLRLNAPLDRGVIEKAKSAYIRDRAAAELNAKRKQAEEEFGYRDLLTQFEDAKSRYRLAESIESAQKDKLEHERQRHRVGRTTTSQVLLFEQDYATSQLSRIRTQAEVMRIAAQLRTYGG